MPTTNEDFDYSFVEALAMLGAKLSNPAPDLMACFGEDTGGEWVIVNGEWVLVNEVEEPINQERSANKK